jgi:hypothetical protein
MQLLAVKDSFGEEITSVLVALGDPCACTLSQCTGKRAKDHRECRNGCRFPDPPIKFIQMFPRKANYLQYSNITPKHPNNKISKLTLITTQES